MTSRLERMAKLGPAFVTITWGAGGSTAEKTVRLAQLCQRELRLTTCMHLTCTNMKRELIDEALVHAKNIGIRNILALRGDPPRGEEYWTPVDSQFTHAVDLVKYIREKYGDYFCIGVAAYPEGHVEGSGPLYEGDPRKDLQYLVEKVRAGAEFVITQLFYDVDKFLAFQDMLQQHPSGAFKHIAVLPGLMPLNTYQSFIRAAKFSHASIPESMQQELNKVSVGDDEAIKQFGVKWLCEIIKTIQQKTSIKGFHFYTLNLEKSVALVLEHSDVFRSKFVNDSAITSDDEDDEASGTVPASYLGPSNGFLVCKHRTSCVVTRNRVIVPHKDEEAKSGEDSDVVSENEAGLTVTETKGDTALSISTGEGALGREATWDDFPNGRFGDSRSPAYGELTGYGPTLHVGKDEALRLWGYPADTRDITALFVGHLTSELDALPFSDQSLSAETALIQEELLQLNNKGYWTIASQPAGNAIRTDDKIFGWGPPGGYVFQKAFVEIFISDDDWKVLKLKLDALTPEISYYQASNIPGREFSTSLSKGASNAVTWGVFPNREIVQSTIIEEESFLAWKEEVFNIWREWQYLYNPRSASFKLLEQIYNSYHLVTVLHHDYFQESALWDVLINA